MINNIIKKIIREATSEMGSRGSYINPLQPGIRDFDKNKLAPFTDSVSDYKSPLVTYDSYDHKFSLRKDQIRELEKTARKVTNYIKRHPYSTFSDDEGNVINPTPSGKIKKDPYNLEIVPIKRKINEADTSISAGQYNGPIEIGLKKWKKEELGPFTEFVDTEVNHKKKQKTLKNNIKRVVGKWEKSKDGSYDIDTHDVHTINEDLAVWFGKKKKPKGSKQPKGPWVNICRKVDGKHPPCGRPDTSKGGYPKCRAAGVAGKMSDSEKRSACQQKRNAEKKDTQTGKGQKPIMTSHKKRTNENMKTIITLTETDIKNIVQRVLNENILNEDLSNIPDNLKRSPINLKCFGIPTDVNPRGSSKEYSDYLITDYNDAGGIERFFFSKQSENLDMSFGSANEKSDIQLDIVPIQSDRLRTIFKLDNSEQFLLKHTYANTSYYCSVKQESNDWKTYFDNLGVATDINV